MTNPPRFRGRGKFRHTDDGQLFVFQKYDGTWTIETKAGKVICKADTYPRLKIEFHRWWMENGEDKRNKEVGRFPI